MSYLSAPDDDTPPHRDQSNDPRRSILRAVVADRRRLNELLSDVERMLCAQIAGDASFTGPGCGVTLSSAHNALENVSRHLRDMRPVVTAEIQPRRHFGLRKPGPLPAVRSPEAF